MRCTFKTVFYVNGSKERNGIVPIMGRVTINGTIAQFSCKQSVTKAIWDAKGNRAIGKSKEAKGGEFCARQHQGSNRQALPTTFRP